MTTEEFTFPISASAAGGAFIDSPPLWRHVGPTQATSASSSSSSSSEEEEREHHTLQRKSYSSIEGGGIDHYHRLIEMDDTDRMDLLWEDFNEDLPRNRNSFTANFDATDDDEEDEFPPELGCVPTALNLSKAVSGVSPSGGRAVIAAENKKLRLVVFAKVFKRLFLLQHHSVNVKKRSSTW